MTDIPHSSRALIHLSRLKENLQTIRRRMPGIELMGVVKANAYGHGSKDISLELEKQGVEKLSVATVSEAVALREAGVSARILVFAPPTEASLPLYFDYELDAIVDSPQSLSLFSESGTRIDVHAKIDTGMGRLGVSTGEAARLSDLLNRLPG